MKRSFTFLFCIVFLLTIKGFSQPPDLVWAKSVKRTTGVYNIENSLVVDAAGNMYRTGRFTDTTDFDPGPGVCNLISKGLEDTFVLKLGPSGAFVWAKQFSGSDYDKGTSVAVDAMGNVYVTGCFYDTCDFDPGPGVYGLISSGHNDIFLTKLNASGNLIWAKRIGDLYYDQAFSIAIDAGGSVYLTGTFGGTVDFDPGAGVFNLSSTIYWDVFICKINSAGGLVWAKEINGGGWIAGIFVTVSSSGEVYATGGFSGAVDFDPGPGTSTLSASASACKDVFLIKLDASGNFVWARQVTSNDMMWCYAIAIDPGGSLSATGIFEGTVDFDPGTGIYNITSLGQNAFVLKLDPSGNFAWAGSFVTQGGVVGNSIAMDAGGNVYTAGHFNDSTDFDPGPGLNIFVPLAYNHAFINKLDAAGNFVWTLQIESNSGSHAQALALHGNSIYLAGVFYDNADLDPGPGMLNMYTDNNDFFFLKLKNMNTNTENTESSLLAEEEEPLSPPEPEQLIPNVFTPDGDGINDLFFLPGKEEELQIYDRWGNYICRCTGWDGRNSRGEECSQGVYYYIANSSKGNTAGFVQLVR